LFGTQKTWIKFGNVYAVNYSRQVSQTIDYIIPKLKIILLFWKPFHCSYLKNFEYPTDVMHKKHGVKCSKKSKAFIVWIIWII
jgi:hypothetical protein